MATERLNKGINLKYGDGASPEVFAQIGLISAINGVGVERDVLDRTVHDTTAIWKEFRAGLATLKPITITVKWDPADSDHDAILDLLIAGTVTNFTIDRPGTATNAQWAFAAVVTDYEEDNDIEGLMMADITLTPTGALTIGDVS